MAAQSRPGERERHQHNNCQHGKADRAHYSTKDSRLITQTWQKAEKYALPCPSPTGGPPWVVAAEGHSIIVRQIATRKVALRLATRPASGDIRRRVRRQTLGRRDHVSREAAWVVVDDGDVTMTDEEASELRDLRRRMYGPGSGAGLDAPEFERLQLLEEREKRGSFPTVEVGAVGHDDGEGASAGKASSAGNTSDDRGRNWKLWLGAAVAGLAFVGVGYAAGAATSARQAPTTLPEFQFDQTLEDEIPEGVLTQDYDSVDPDSTRFVGVVDGYYIYLAQDRDGDLVCLLTVTGIPEPRIASMGCTSGPLPAGLRVSVSETLELEVGEAETPESGGNTIKLSESVTAFVL